jgi:hypothetical protein
MSENLTPGATYTYTFRARWTSPNGQLVEQTRQIRVVSGEERVVDFLAPAAQ